MACNIQNAYLTADFREQIWVVARTKFGSESGNNMLVRKALYALKKSGTEFRAFLSETLDIIGCRPRYSNPDLWLRPEVDPYGFEYYEYVL